MKTHSIKLLIFLLLVGACNTPNAPEVDGNAVEEESASPSEEMTSLMTRFDNERVACEPNLQLEALAPILSGGRTHPTGRGEQSAAFDPCNQRIILFGGNDFQPEECADFGPKRFQGDTWMYSIEFNNWARITTEVAPSPRGRHSMVLDRSRKQIYLFGGRFRPEESNGNYEVFGDFWAFDLNTDTWSQYGLNGAVPSPRYNAAMVYDHLSDRVILFGGNSSNNGLNLTPLNDTYILDLQTYTWTVVTGPAPPPSIYHSMTMYTADNKVLLFGGGDANAFLGPFYTNVWALDLETLSWDEVWTDQDGVNPGGRINSAWIDDPERERVLMFGGHDDTRVGHRNDVWSFTVTEGWTELNAGDTGVGQGCDAFCSCPPDFVEVDINSPERREYQTFIPILGEQRAVLFGGKSDCGYLDDTWSLDFTNATWTELEPAGQGEACARTGQEGCTDLCY